MTPVALAEHSVVRGRKSARTAATKGAAKKNSEPLDEIPIRCCGTATLLLAVMGDSKLEKILPKQHHWINRQKAMEQMLASFHITQAEVESLVTLRKQGESAPKVNGILKSKKKWSE